MDRDAPIVGENEDPLLVPSGTNTQTSPLLENPDNGDINDDGAEDDPDRYEMCWCCPLYRCVCGGCDTKHPQPLGVRTLDCIAHIMFWCSGMYAPGGNFSRWRFNLASNLNLKRAGRFSKLRVTSFDTSIASSYVAGLSIPIRVYEPDVVWPSKMPMVYYHGGGFCLGDAAMENFDTLCAKIASKLSVVIVSVSYRLAPEHPFPAGVQDCHDGIRQVFESPAILSKNIDVSNGVLLAGDSAGGNLACVIASLCRDKLDANLKPFPLDMRIRHQLLIYPALFMQHLVEEDFADGSAFIPKPVTTWFRLSYLPDAKSVRDVERLSLTERRLCPFVAGFQGMPPTTIVSAGLDHLRHENRIAAQQFVLAGVDCVHRHVENVPHGFMTFHFLRQAKETLDLVIQDIQRQSEVASGPKNPRHDSLIVNSKVEIIGCLGARGKVILVRQADKIAEIDLGWGKAYAPTTNLLVLDGSLNV